MNLYHYAGIGDWMQITSILTDAEIASIETLYWASKTEPVLRPVIEACPPFKHIKHVKLWDEPLHHVTRMAEVPWEILQCHTSRYHALFNRRPHRGCPFLDHQLCELDIELPDRYAVIQPSTPYNPASYRVHRDMKTHEWPALLKWLERKDLQGVVINSPDGEPAPEHPLLVDLTGETTLLQAIEIVKRSYGYIGIESWASILCAQLHPAEMLHITTRNPHVRQNPWNYYSPHQTYEFLVGSIGGSSLPTRPRPQPDPNSRFIMLTKGGSVNNTKLPVGAVLEVSEVQCRQDVGRGYAIEIFQDEVIRPAPLVNGIRIKMIKYWATEYFNHQPGQVLVVSDEVARTMVEAGGAVLVA